MAIKDENYINIQGWMVNELKLKGNELILYALIYGFSQTDGQVYNGGLQYLADWTSSTKQGVIKNLKSLVEKGYIIKKEATVNNVKFCEYYVTKFNGVLNKVEWGIKQSLTGGIKQSLTGGIKQSLPNNTTNNNTNNNIIDIKENNKKKEQSLECVGNFPTSPSKSIDIEKDKELEIVKESNIKEKSKHKFGEYQRILLTDDEYSKLCNEYGKDYINDVIGRIDEYVEQNNNKNKYKNFYLVIKKAIRDKWSILNGIEKDYYDDENFF